MKKIRWINHVLIRLLQRNITQKDVINALLNGEIIDYPDNVELEDDMKTRRLNNYELFNV